VSVVFVNGLAGLAALAGLLPLAALWRVSRRGRRVRSGLGLPDPDRRRVALVAGAVVLLSVLVGAACAQPVLIDSQPQYARTDAEAYVVLDITRSMLASRSPEEPKRLDRAREAAARLRRAVPDVRVGIASLTNRLVPHVFPTTNGAVFERGLDWSIEIERPAPDAGPGALSTAFDALAPLQTHNFFSPVAKRRVAVVLTDGETRPVSAETMRALRGTPRLDVLVVRFWSADERIFRRRTAEDETYRADPASGAQLASFAAESGARVFSEDELGAAERALRARLGTGERVVVGREASSHPLAAWAIGLAAVPLAYLLRRRNL
jgi:hypothetical protein